MPMPFSTRLRVQISSTLPTKKGLRQVLQDMTDHCEEFETSKAAIDKEIEKREKRMERVESMVLGAPSTQHHQVEL